MKEFKEFVEDIHKKQVEEIDNEDRLLRELEKQIITYQERKSKARNNVMTSFTIIEKGFKKINVELIQLSTRNGNNFELYKNKEWQDSENYTYKLKVGSLDSKISGRVKYLGKQLKPTSNSKLAKERLLRLENKFVQETGLKIYFNQFSIEHNTDAISFEIYISNQN